MPASPLAGQAQTVLGPIAGKAMGITLPHEHLCGIRSSGVPRLSQAGYVKGPEGHPRGDRRRSVLMLHMLDSALSRGTGRWGGGALPVLLTDFSKAHSVVIHLTSRRAQKCAKQRTTIVLLWHRLLRRSASEDGRLRQGPEGRL